MASRLLPNNLVMGLMKYPMRGLLGISSLEYGQVRGLKNNKHRDPKFKNLRRLKMQSGVLVKYQKNYGLSVSDGVSQNVVNLRKVWKERDVCITSSSSIVDEFVLPENQGKAITEELKRTWNNVGKFGKDKMAVRKIRGFETEFNMKVFQDEAKAIYIKAHECLAVNDQEHLNEYVTEYARLAMVSNSSQRTIRWKYLQSLEEPKVVQVRVFQLDENANMFAQITVRMLSQQCLAVYDRFGRLIYGSEILAKDVLEYAVFEKHLSNEYGVWRLHAKLFPHDRVQMAEHTFVVPKELPQETSGVVTEAATESGNMARTSVTAAA